MRAMKDSGIEWIGQIPQGWSVGKTIFGLEMPITDGPHETPQLYSEGIPFVSAEAVSTGNGKINFENIRGYISQEYYEECCKKYIPQKEDIYMIKSGATTGKIAIVDTDDVFTIWSPLAVFRCNKERCISRFLFYTLQSDYYQKQLESKWSFGTQQNIGMRTLERLLICYPAVPEQERIVDYLDAKCAAIDALIATKEKTNALLKERRQSIIYEAVTKGLNPDAPMKDSGIEWIGQIPVHWAVERLKPHIEFNPKTEIPEYEEDDSVSFIPMDCLRRGVHTSQTVDYSKVKSGYVDFKEGDILMAKVTPCLENGNLVIVGNLIDGVGFGSTEINVIRCKSIHKEYLFFILQCKTYIERAVADMYGVAGLKRLNPSFIPNTKYPMPSIAEQQEIAEYLAATCSEIDEQVAANERTIEKLKEYRQSIIYEAVTGKIEI